MKSISTFDFPSTIANDLLHVDKTAHTWKMQKNGKDECFLSRPWRCGKSPRGFIVATIREFFAALLPAVCIGANFDFSKGLLTNWAETTIA